MKFPILARNALAAVALSALALTAPAMQGVWTSPAVAEVPMMPNVADLAERLLPSVVEISVESKANGADSVVQDTAPNDSPFKDFFDEFLKRRNQQGQPGQQGQKDQPKDNNGDQGNNGGDGQGDNGDGGPDGNGKTVNSLGSGFVIDSAGLIVTNNHVVDGEVKMQVHLQDGTILKAELVGHDPKTDIAVIRVKSDKPLPAVAFADSDKVRVGEWALAIGNPFGLGGSVSLGIISARNRDINAGPYDDYFQTDAAINKGNSGGPLFNMNGEVVGVNTAIFSPTGGSVGIGFSVPANTVKNVVAQLVKYGETRRGWLGVKIQSVTPDLAETMGLDKAKGALVADVTADSPSEKAGLKTGDVIIGFDGRAIADSKELPRVVAETDVGKAVDVKIMRDGKEQTVKVVLGRLEDGEKQLASVDTKKPVQVEPPTKITEVLGMSLGSLDDAARAKFKIDDKVKGVVVEDVAGSSAAVDKGVEAGDVVLEAAGKPVESPDDVSAAADQAAKDGKSSLLLLMSKAGKAGDTRFIALKLKK
jgi:serine protease Do